MDWSARVKRIRQLPLSVVGIRAFSLPASALSLDEFTSPRECALELDLSANLSAVCDLIRSGNRHIPRNLLRFGVSAMR
jgi:hypothetical protein